MARVLSLAGARLPASLVPAHPKANPTGFWEPKAVVDFNEALLHRDGSAWDDLFALRAGPVAFKSQDVQAAADLLEAHYAAAPDCGASDIVLKDPRISVLLPLWTAALERAGYTPRPVLMVRHPLEVARSLHARDGFPECKGLLLWASYMLAAERDTRGQDRALVSFSELLANASGVLRSLGVMEAGEALSSSTDGFLSSNLRHWSVEGEPIIAAGVDFAEGYAALQQAADGLGDDRTLALRLDRLACALKACTTQRSLPGKADVQMCYQLWLGRSPTPSDPLEAKQGLAWQGLFASFFGGVEFREAVLKPLMQGSPGPGWLREPVTMQTRLWAADVLPLSSAGRNAVLAASRQAEALGATIGDPEFQCLAVRLDRTLRDPAIVSALLNAAAVNDPSRHYNLLFPQGSNALTTSPASSEPLRWLIVGAAPFSGLDVLRRRLLEQPGVALLRPNAFSSMVTHMQALVDATALDEGAPEEAALADAAGGRGRLDAVARGVLQPLVGDAPLRLAGVCRVMDGTWEDIAPLKGRLGHVQLALVLRDPRSAVAAWLAACEADADQVGTERLADALSRWLGAWRCAVALKAAYGEDVTLIKFDELHENPAALADLFSRVGLAADPLAAVPAHDTAEPSLAAASSTLVDEIAGELLADWPHLPLEALLQRHRQLSAPYALGDRVRLSDHRADPYLESSFSWREDWGRWTDGSMVCLHLVHPPVDTSVLLELWIAWTFAAPGEGCDVLVEVGDAAPQFLSLRGGGERFTLLGPPGAARRGRTRIRIHVLRTKPREAAAADQRRLGFGLEAFRFSAVAAS